MTLVEIQERARKMGVNLRNKTKSELIHSIQSKEGNTPCFGWFRKNCPYTNCCWRSDCFRAGQSVPAAHVFDVE